MRSAAARPGQRARAARRAHRARRHRRRERAGLGRARRGRPGQAPERADRRPARGEQADRVLPGAGRRATCSSSLQDLGAAGPVLEHQRDGRRRASVGLDLDVAKVPLREAGHGAVRDHDLRVPGADAVRGRAGAAGRGARRLPQSWETSATPIGEVTDTRPAARVRRRASWSATCRSRRSSTSARSTTSSRQRARRPAGRLRGAARRGSRRGRDAGRHASRAARLARTSPAGAGRSSSTTSSSAAARCAGPEQADAAVLRLALRRRRHRPRRSRSRSTATGAAWPATRTSARPRRSCECAANLACVGAEPLGLTNCLNFGNPEKPHVAWQLTRAVEGMAAACRALGVPVVGGNVSLYNEGAGRPDLPDAGRRDGRRAARPGARRRRVRSGLPRRRAATWSRSSARSARRCWAPSWRSCAATLRGGLPAVRPGGGARRRSSSCARRSGRAPSRSAHDVSDGGLACCVAESALARRRRVRRSTSSRCCGARRSTPTTALFGEGPGGIVVSGPREALMELSRRAPRSRLPGARHGGRRAHSDRCRRC